MTKLQQDQRRLALASEASGQREQLYSGRAGSSWRFAPLGGAATRPLQCPQKGRLGTLDLGPIAEVRTD